MILTKRKSLALLLAAILLSLSLSSCGMHVYQLTNAQQAVSMYRHSLEKLRYSPTYTYAYTFQASLHDENTPLTYRIEGNQSFNGLGIEPVHTVYMKTTTSQADKQMQVTEQTYGFMDGKMFVHYKNGTVENKLYSSISYEDYLAHRQQISESMNGEELDPHSAENQKATENPDGSWTLKFSAFSNVDIKLFLDSFGMYSMVKELSDTYTVSDLQIESELDEDLFPIKTTTSVIFAPVKSNQTANDASAPVIALVEQYSTKPVNVSMDESNFTKVADLRVLDNLSLYQGNWENLDRASFSHDATVTATSNKNTHKETIQITGNSYFNNETYTFRITLKNSASSLQYDYANGKITVTDRNTKESESTAMTEEEARTYFAVMSEMPLPLDASTVTAIEQDPENEDQYILTLGNGTDFLYTMFFSQGKIKESTIRATVGYTDGAPNGTVVYTIETTGSEGGSNNSVSTTYTCTYANNQA